MTGCTPWICCCVWQHLHRAMVLLMQPPAVYMQQCTVCVLQPLHMRRRVLACAAVVVLAQTQWPGQPASILNSLQRTPRQPHSQAQHPFLVQLPQQHARPTARRLLWTAQAEALQWRWQARWTL